MYIQPVIFICHIPSIIGIVTAVVVDRLMPMSGKDMLKVFLKDGWLVPRKKVVISPSVNMAK
jgi:hypothetical protein